MKLRIPRPVRHGSAFSIIEVMVGVLIVMVMFVSLYVGVAQGFGIMQLARENLRATQILEEKMETIRLYTFDQMNSNGFIPTNFVAPFYSVGEQTNSGFRYYGSLSIVPAPMLESYRDDLRLVTVSLFWTNGNARRTRSMQTMVARWGLQNYIF